MPKLRLTVLSLRYSSWSMRPWLALTHAGAEFVTDTVELPDMGRQADPSDVAKVEATSLSERRALGSVRGLFPVLRIDGVPIHESLAICEYAAEAFPAAGLWPESALARAEARAICSEMATGFTSMRAEMSCHLFGRVPRFSPSAAARADADRVFEIWNECLDRSGGPFLFGRFGIADAMYFPALTRFRTYGVPLPGDLRRYAEALDDQPAVCALIGVARTAPHIPVYDAYLIGLGGEPDAALAAS
ncbi:MAG TPA: glutathione S-transferase C-terminal domain-containing protein [Gammaproteobacteria bacterium]|nr:glutathione S-transferase C-terminal domain-containing protein [Gammaproteobacteria bacterium]